MTLVTLGSWFHIVAFFSLSFLYLATTAHHQIKQYQERQEGERKRQEGQGVWKRREKRKKRCHVKQSYKTPGQEAQEYCQVARNTHQQPLEVENTLVDKDFLG